MFYKCCNCAACSDLRVMREELECQACEDRACLGLNFWGGLAWSASGTGRDTHIQEVPNDRHEGEARGTA
jgi:hypothetical protein